MTKLSKETDTEIANTAAAALNSDDSSASVTSYRWQRYLIWWCRKATGSRSDRRRFRYSALLITSGVDAVV